MKKSLPIILCISAGLVFGCSAEKTTEVRKAPLLDKTTPEVISADAKGAVEEDGYIKYRGAEWAGEQDGVKIKVNSVSLAEDLAEIYTDVPSASGEKGAFIWVAAENTSNSPAELDFLSAALVTDDGWEVDVELMLSDFSLEELRPGSKKDGDLIFTLNQASNVRELKSVKLYFKVNGKEVEAPITLK